MPKVRPEQGKTANQAVKSLSMRRKQAVYGTHFALSMDLIERSFKIANTSAAP
jgi:hypothetical protein